MKHLELTDGLSTIEWSLPEDAVDLITRFKGLSTTLVSERLEQLVYGFLEDLSDLRCPSCLCKELRIRSSDFFLSQDNVTVTCQMCRHEGVLPTFFYNSTSKEESQ